MSNRVFAEWAEAYRAAGFWPRPVSPRSKACYAKDWQKPDPELPPATLAMWLESHADYGIGLLMGSPFPDGTTLGALDIDHDDYTRLGAALLRDPPCGRIGKKGAVFFVRVRGTPRSLKFRGISVGECLLTRTLCVIPPTMHPETHQPYRWIGKPLLETQFDELPIVEM